MHKIVLIGAGRIGHIHARNIALNPRLELAGVVDTAASAAESLASEWQTSALDLDTALGDTAIHGVIIASSTNTHLEYSKRAAAAGKAIFCEKPIDLDLQRARKAAGELGNARMLVGFNRRFDPNFQALKARLDTRAVGKLESLRIASNDPAPPPPAYIAVSGGLFKDMAIHDFDIARWLLGEEPSQVYATGSCLVDPQIGALGDIDTACCVLTTASGKQCVITNSRRSGFGYDQRIEAYGSAGMIRADNLTQSTVETWSENGAAADCFQNFFLDRYVDAYRKEMDHYADVLEGATPMTGYADGVAALALAEAAGQSVKTGQSVNLP
jgi:myo-inositol 2-dehydrogenase/D-chiro-inositol 1-dehydrogenase